MSEEISLEKSCSFSLCIPKFSLGYWYAPGFLAVCAVGTQIILRWPVTTTIWPPTSKLNDSTDGMIL